MSIHYFTPGLKYFMKYSILLPHPGTVDSWTANPGTAELQLGIAMADPGVTEPQLGIHARRRLSSVIPYFLNLR